MYASNQAKHWNYFEIFYDVQFYLEIFQKVCSKPVSEELQAIINSAARPRHSIVGIIISTASYTTKYSIYLTSYTVK